jgi:hypothetical protein
MEDQPQSDKPETQTNQPLTQPETQAKPPEESKTNEPPVEASKNVDDTQKEPVPLSPSTNVKEDVSLQTPKQNMESAAKNKPKSGIKRPETSKRNIISPTSSNVKTSGYYNLLSICTPSRKQQRSLVAESIKMSNDMEKEKKTYEQRVQAMKNKIASLKKQEELLAKKMRQQELKREEMERIKDEKNSLKTDLMNAEKRIKKDLEKRSQHVAEEKTKLDQAVKQSLKDNLTRKQLEYRHSMNDKIKHNNNRKRYLTELGKVNKDQIMSIRGQHQQMKEDRMKYQIDQEEAIKEFYEKKKNKDYLDTQHLKDELVKLEEMEKKYFENLKITKQKSGMFIKDGTMLSMTYTDKKQPSKRGFSVAAQKTEKVENVGGSDFKKRMKSVAKNKSDKKGKGDGKEIPMKKDVKFEDEIKKEEEIVEKKEENKKEDNVIENVEKKEDNEGK